MSLPSFADLDDLAAAGVSCDPTGGEHALWVVSTAVRGIAGQSFAGDDGDLIDMPALASDLLRSVTVEAAGRRLRNPDGATARSEGLGPFSEQVTVDSGNIYFTKAERANIATATGLAYPTDGGFPGLGTISTTRGPLETAAVCGGVSGDPVADDPFGRGW